jgi:nitrate/nitrite transport system permease protein
MSQPALSLTPAPPADPPAAANAAPAEVVAMPRKAGFDSDRFKERLSETGGKVLPPIGMLLIVLLIWQGLTSAAPGGLPAPTMVWMESKDLILNPFFDHGGVDKGLFWHVLTSLKRVAVGYGFAAVVGIALGVLVGSSTLAHRGLDPIFQVLRTVPPLAWLPISLAAFHQAQPSALFVIFITAIWPIIINTAVGVRNIPQDYVNVGRVLRLSPPDYFFTILLPAATPYIFTGMRIGVGIGFFIWDQYNSSRISDIIVALVWVGLVGFALDRLIAFVGNLVARGAAAN